MSICYLCPMPPISQLTDKLRRYKSLLAAVAYWLLRQTALYAKFGVQFTMM